MGKVAALTSYGWLFGLVGAVVRIVLWARWICLLLRYTQPSIGVPNDKGIQMSENNKAILEEANAAIAKGHYEGFLAFCADDTEWTFVGEQTFKGKEAVRQWMATEYVEPPTNMVAHMVAEGDFVVAVGTIATKDKNGKAVRSSYADIWRFREGMIAELQAFVIQSEVKDETRGAV